jgi:hypothetical protein
MSGSVEPPSWSGAAHARNLASAALRMTYRLGARSYLVKPMSLEQRLAMVQALKTFWLELSRIPEPVVMA